MKFIKLGLIVVILFFFNKDAVTLIKTPVLIPSTLNLGMQDPSSMISFGPNAAASVATGNLYFTLPLFACKGVGFPAHASLFYNSLETQTNPILSKGWQLNYQMNVAELSPVKLQIQFEDGRKAIFDDVGAGNFKAQFGFGEYSTAKRNTVSGVVTSYELKTKLGVKYIFNNIGQLTQIRDTQVPTPNTLSLLYSDGALFSITDSIGRFLQKDPVAENIAIEHYAYADNNPIQKTDAFGMYWEAKRDIGGLPNMISNLQKYLGMALSIDRNRKVWADASRVKNRVASQDFMDKIWWPGQNSDSPIKISDAYSYMITKDSANFEKLLNLPTPFESFAQTSGSLSAYAATGGMVDIISESDRRDYGGYIKVIDIGTAALNPTTGISKGLGRFIVNQGLKEIDNQYGTNLNLTAGFIKNYKNIGKLKVPHSSGVTQGGGGLKQYPKKVGKFESHHIDPKYMGGNPKGRTVRIPAEYHQQITNEFRKEWKYGKGFKPDPKEFEDIKRRVYKKFPISKWK